MARLLITEQALREAWQRTRRAHWPATFEQAQAVPLVQALVRAEAIRAAQAAAPRRRAPYEVKPHPAPAGRHTPPPAAPPQQRLWDPKRAAAGDTED